MAGGVQTGQREGGGVAGWGDGGGVAGRGDGGGGQGETEMELETGGQQRLRAGEMRGRGQETEVQKRRKAAMRGVKTERRRKKQKTRGKVLDRNAKRSTASSFSCKEGGAKCTNHPGRQRSRASLSRYLAVAVQVLESEARNNCAVCADCFPEALRSHYSVM